MDIRYWAIHSNPDIWKSELELKECDEGMFKINDNHKDLFKLGDKGILWVSGKNAGIYSFIEVISDPFITFFHYDILRKYAIQKGKFMGQHLVVKVKYYEKLLYNPIKRHIILNDNILKEKYAFRNPQGLNSFELTNEEYEKTLNLK